MISQQYIDREKHSALQSTFIAKLLGLPVSTSDLPDESSLSEIAARLHSHYDPAIGRNQLSNSAQLASILVNKAIEHCLDRKSTRLNSSHITISYAVFCLKKKKKTTKKKKKKKKHR